MKGELFTATTDVAISGVVEGLIGQNEGTNAQWIESMDLDVGEFSFTFNAVLESIGEVTDDLAEIKVALALTFLEVGIKIGTKRGETADGH